MSAVLRQIWSDNDYVYAVTTSGLNVIEIESESLYAYAINTNGFTTVWANDTQIFLGTSSDGVKVMNKNCITGSIVAPHDIVSCVNNYLDDTYLTSNEIRYIHGYDDRFVCCTDIGVDVVKLEVLGYVNYTTISGALKCFMTSGQSFYYTTISGINRVDGYKSDWTTPDVVYTTGGGWLPADEEVQDIFATTNTSSIDGYNTVFAATTSGAYVYDEGTNGYNVYLTSSGILAGSSDNITAVWADLDAGLDKSNFYVASAGVGAALSAIDMATQSLFDSYTKHLKGVSDETLNAEGIEDLNVVSGS